MLTTAVVVVMALVAGTALSLWQAFEATQARKLANERLAGTTEALGRETKARTDADEQRHQASANLQIALDAVEQMLMRVADDRLAAFPGTEPVRQELFQDALKFYDEFLRQAPDDPQLRISTAKAWTRVGSLREALGGYEDARQAWLEGINRWESLHADYPDDRLIQATLAQEYRYFGGVEHYRAQKFASAETALNRAMSLWHDLQRRFPDELDYQWSGAETETNLGATYMATNRVDLADRALRHAVDVQRSLWSRDTSKRNPQFCYALLWRAQLCWLAQPLADDKNRDAEAELLYLESIQRGEEILRSDSRPLRVVQALATVTLDYGNFLQSRERLDEAEKVYRRAVDVGQLTPRGDPRVLGNLFVLPRVQVALADLLARRGRHLETLPIYRAAGDVMRPITLLPEQYGIWEGIYRAADNGLVRSLEQLALTGHLDESRKFCEELNQTSGSGAIKLQCRMLAANAWKAIGDAERRQQLLHEAIQQLESDAGAPQQLVGAASGISRTYNRLARTLIYSGDPKGLEVPLAIQLARRAVELSPDKGYIENTLGVAYYRAEKWTEAVEHLEKSINLNTDQSFAHNGFFLAMAHWQLGSKEQARQWYDQSVDWLTKNNESNDQELIHFRREASQLLGATAEKTE